MTNLFFYGTLRYPELLRRVLGRDITLLSAELPCYRTVWADGESFPMLIADTGTRAVGVLAQGLDEEDVARLNFYEGAFAYDLRDLTVETAHGPAPAQVYFPSDAPWQPGTDWVLDDWVETWGPLTLLAAAEVMRAYGRESAAEVAHRFGIIRARAQSYVRAQSRARAVTVSSPLTRADIRVDRLDRPYEKFFGIEEYQTAFRRFDGTWSAPGLRAIFRAADAVTVLPYDPVRDHVMLIEQVRMGPYAHGDPQPWLLEPVAGIVDAGETYEQTARREAREEAHIDLTGLHHIAGYYPSPGGVAQFLVSYLGLADLAEDGRRNGGLDHEGEDIRNVLVPFDALMDMLDSGELANAPLIMSVQWLARHRATLRSQSA
jgi:ADP-ribose diphosphatase